MCQFFIEFTKYLKEERKLLVIFYTLSTRIMNVPLCFTTCFPRELLTEPLCGHRASLERGDLCWRQKSNEAGLLCVAHLHMSQLIRLILYQSMSLN